MASGQWFSCRCNSLGTDDDGKMIRTSAGRPATLYESTSELLEPWVDLLVEDIEVEEATCHTSDVDATCFGTFAEEGVSWILNSCDYVSGGIFSGNFRLRTNSGAVKQWESYIAGCCDLRVDYFTPCTADAFSDTYTDIRITHLSLGPSNNYIQIHIGDIGTDYWPFLLFTNEYTKTTPVTLGEQSPTLIAPCGQVFQNDNTDWYIAAYLLPPFPVCNYSGTHFSKVGKNGTVTLNGADGPA